MLTGGADERVQVLPARAAGPFGVAGARGRGRGGAVGLDAAVRDGAHRAAGVWAGRGRHARHPLRRERARREGQDQELVRRRRLRRTAAHGGVAGGRRGEGRGGGAVGWRGAELRTKKIKKIWLLRNSTSNLSHVRVPFIGPSHHGTQGQEGKHPRRVLVHCRQSKVAWPSRT